MVGPGPVPDSDDAFPSTVALLRSGGALETVDLACPPGLRIADLLDTGGASVALTPVAVVGGERRGGWRRGGWRRVETDTGAAGWVHTGTLRRTP